VRNLLSMSGKEPISPGRSLYIVVNILIELSRPLLNDINFLKLRYGFVAPELSTCCLVLYTVYLWSVFTGSDVSGALLSKARCKVYILSDSAVETPA
jgi:hypothetical protein